MSHTGNYVPYGNCAPYGNDVLQMWPGDQFHRKFIHIWSLMTDPLGESTEKVTKPEEIMSPMRLLNPLQYYPNVQPMAKRRFYCCLSNSMEGSGRDYVW